MFTPRRTYSSSLKPLLMPASFSSQTSWPRLTRSPAAAGTSATRPSRVLVSFGTPIRIALLSAMPEKNAASERRLARLCGFPVRRRCHGAETLRPWKLPCFAGTPPPSYGSSRPRSPLVVPVHRGLVFAPQGASRYRRDYTHDPKQARPPDHPRLRSRRPDFGGLRRDRNGV